MAIAEQRMTQESLNEIGGVIGDVYAALPQRIVPGDFIQAGVALRQCVWQGFRHRLGAELSLYDLDESGLHKDHPVRRQLHDFQNQGLVDEDTPNVMSSEAMNTGNKYDLYSACGYADTDFISIERAYTSGRSARDIARIVYRSAGNELEPVLMQKNRGKFTALVVGSFAIDGVNIQPGSLVNISSRNNSNLYDKGNSASRKMPIDEVTDAAYLRPTLYMSQENDWPKRLERMKRLASVLLRADLV